MEGKDVKRRFVQSTLFPHMANSAKEIENCQVGEGEEELCSSIKRRRKPANSKSKTTPRAPAKKATLNGKESKQADETSSAVPDKSNYFVRASERVQQKGQESAVAIIDSADGTDNICTPPSPAADGRTPQKLRRRNSTPRKGKKNSTPNKNIKTGRRELFSGQIPFEVAGDDQTLQTIPDLRLEAKLAAEENLRIFSGKKLHPFFTSRKGVKANQDTTDLENNCSPFGKKEMGIAFNPIHVFENVENGQMALNWGHWIFSERSTSNDLDSAYSPIYEGSIDSLNFGNFLNNSRSTRVSLYENCRQCPISQEQVSEELPHKPESSFPNIPLMLPDGRMSCTESEKIPDFLSSYPEAILAESSFEDNKIERNDQSMGIACGGSIDSDLQEKLLQERTDSHYHACHSQPENCLWTDKYQPQNAKQICGNSESVKFLSDWLGLWHKRGSLASKSCLNEDNLTVQAMNCDYQQSDSDYDTADEEDDLKNVLLITGPVGSGKSAAIYACARDEGFQIIEINTSDWRNGALVRQKFGEAVESHWLQRTAENATDSKSQLKLFKAFNNEATNCSDNKVIELLDNDDPQEAGAWSKLLVSDKNGNANCQSETKTLILFEDVDATLCEDHGFITTIQQLAETAKRPMILTSNSVSPVLPKNLDRSELRFSLPLKEELLGLVHMICASEKAKIHPSLVERFINHSQNDIRKTIMLLQFWYQGQALGKDHPGNEFHTAHWSVLFDINAGHHILPKVIYWDHPSKLSDLVEGEVVKSLILMEETYSPVNMNRGKDQNGYNSEIVPAPDLVPDPIEVKKKAMLRLHCSHDEIECTQFEPNTELFDFSCSPIAPTQERSRRKVNTVLSSDSEDEVIVPPDSAGVNINAESFDLNKLPASHSFDQIHNHSSRLTSHSEVGRSEDFSTQIHGYSTGPTFQTEAYKPEDHWTQFSGHSTGPTYNMCYSQDISVVPESSFVPETEMIKEEDLHSVTVSYGHFINKMGTTMAITYQDSIPIPEPRFDANSSKALHIQETLGIVSELNATYVGQEENGDSLFKFMADVPRSYQLPDECSRVDLMKAWKPLENLEADHTVDFGKDAWKKLYCRKNDLRKYVTAEEKTACRGLKLACGMSDLISEADLLLKGCQTLISDSSEPYMIPGEKAHSCCYHETQLEMSSILSQHGMCLYAKEIISLGTPASSNISDLAAEMLSFSADSSALGKLASMDQKRITRPDINMPREFNHLRRSSKSHTCLSSILQTVIPLRSHLTAKGHAFHEYVSTLSQISRFDASRLSKCPDNKMQRRARAQRHYLSSGSLSLESDDISLLGRYNSYQQKA